MATTKTKEGDSKAVLKDAMPSNRTEFVKPPKRPKRKPKPAAAPHAYGPPVVVEVQVTVKALAFREADGRYSVVVPELPGCITMGDDIDHVRDMVADAAGGWLDAQHDLLRDGAIRDVTEPLPSEARG